MGLPERAIPMYVEKLALPAIIMMTGADPLRGAFALSPAAALREGPETLLELLNGTDRVLPFTLPDDSVVLVARIAIDWVEVESGVDPAWVRPPTFWITREEEVEVRIADGRTMVGTVAMELPDHLNRISDYLNMPEDFFPLVTRQGTRLVNKARLANVRLFASSPPPTLIDGSSLRP